MSHFALCKTDDQSTGQTNTTDCIDLCSGFAQIHSTHMDQKRKDKVVCVCYSRLIPDLEQSSMTSKTFQNVECDSDYKQRNLQQENWSINT